MSYGDYTEVVQSFLPLGFKEDEIGERLCMYQYPTFIPHLSHFNPTVRAFPLEKAVYAQNLSFRSS